MTSAGVSATALEKLNRGKPETARITPQGQHLHGAALIEKFQLGNGLRVLMWRDTSAPVFAYQTWFRVGSRHEKRGKTGIAHLFEHLMFKATKNMDDGAFDKVMEEHGAQTNAATWVDWTYYREKLPAGNLELVVRLEADRMENVLLNEQQLASEREVVKNERLLRVDNDPEGKMYEELYALAFEKHPYGSPTIGWMEDINGLTLRDCTAFYRLYYAPNNATVVIVGDFDRIEALELLQSSYGHLKNQPLPVEDTVTEPKQTIERRQRLSLPVAAERGLYAWKSPAATEAGHAPMEVLNEILTGGESSRLHKLLVTEQELASEVGGWVPAWEQQGLFELSLTMRPDQPLAEAERAMDEILEQVMCEPVGERELTKAKNGLEADFLRGTADVSTRARGLGNAESTMGDFRWFFEQTERLRAVTAKEVLQVSREILPRARRSVIEVRPAEAP